MRAKLLLGGKEYTVNILGRDDFAGYDYNNPEQFTWHKWELVEFADGLRGWAPARLLERLS